MKIGINRRYVGFSLLIFIVVFGFSFARLDLRVKTTIIGYKIGKMKEKEKKLIKKRGILTMRLAKISTKDALLRKIKKGILKKSIEDIPYASK